MTQIKPLAQTKNRSRASVLAPALAAFLLASTAFASVEKNKCSGMLLGRIHLTPPNEPLILHPSDAISPSDKLGSKAVPESTQALLNEVLGIKSELNITEKEIHSLQDQKLPRYEDDDSSFLLYLFKGPKKPPREVLEKIDAQLKPLYELETKLKSDLDSARARLSDNLSRVQPLLVESAQRILLGPNADHLLSQIWSAMIDQIPKSQTVSLMVGNRHDETSEALENEATAVAHRLAKDGYVVIYDADSYMGPILREALGDRGIGITASHAQQNLEHRTIAIENDYLRLMALSHGHKKIISADSTSGVAVYLNDERGTDFVVLDPDNRFPTLDPVSHDMRSRHLGVSFPHIRRSKTAEELLKRTSPIGMMLFYEQRNPPSASLKVNLHYFEAKELMYMLNRTNEIVRSLSHDIRGAVIFGSGRSDPKSEQRTYDIAYQLGREGIAISNGGAGGSMLAASEGAFHSGTMSIGVPVVGLKGESHTYREVQTSTIETSDYISRIPTLLARKKLIIFAPGGNGTMKELAVTLIKEQGKRAFNSQIIFTDQAYYSSLFTWLKKTDLPEDLLKRFSLDEKPESIRARAERMLESDPSMRQVENPSLRSTPEKVDTDVQEDPGGDS